MKAVFLCYITQFNISFVLTRPPSSLFLEKRGSYFLLFSRFSSEMKIKRIYSRKHEQQRTCSHKYNVFLCAFPLYKQTMQYLWSCSSYFHIKNAIGIINVKTTSVMVYAAKKRNIYIHTFDNKTIVHSLYLHRTFTFLALIFSKRLHFTIMKYICFA